MTSASRRHRLAANYLAATCAMALFAAVGASPVGAQTPAAAPGQSPDGSKLSGRPSADTLLATVNGKKITQGDVSMAADDLGQTLPQQLQGKARDAYVLDYLIDAALVAQKAKSEKLGDTKEFAQREAYDHDKLLMEALLGQIAKSATSDAELHKIYDTAAAAQKPQEEVHARHILVPTEADAQAALKRVKGGEDFAKVAKEVSKDPGSQGGDLGWFTRERMVPAFADAAFKLQDGQISDPVKTQFGWHIIKLEGKRKKPFPSFDQVKDQLFRFAIQKAQSDLIVTLRKDAKIQRTDAAPSDKALQAAPGQAAPSQAPAPAAPTPAPAPDSKGK